MAVLILAGGRGGLFPNQTHLSSLGHELLKSLLDQLAATGIYVNLMESQESRAFPDIADYAEEDYYKEREVTVEECVGIAVLDCEVELLMDVSKMFSHILKRGKETCPCNQDDED